MRLFLFLFFLAWMAHTALHAQEVLYTETFNECSLPPNWQVVVTGAAAAPVWSVGMSQIAGSVGESIDSTCFLYVDDYTPGNKAPAYSIDFISPAFDASAYTTIELHMDVHYRSEAEDYFAILVTDGVRETEITRFDKYRSMGPNWTAHVNFKYDLALVSASPTLQVILRYNDGNGDYGWWAAVDNIVVTGSGSGKNVLTEAFNQCEKPSGWETTIVQGEKDWVFGRIPRHLPVFSTGSSMDGSCFAYFHDAEQGAQPPPSTVRMQSPLFPGADFFRYTLDFDVIMRYYTEKFTLRLENDAGASFVLYTSSGDEGGPNFPNYVHHTFDLSPYRAPHMRLIFEYTDGGGTGYWIGIDNIKVTGTVPAHDNCLQAQPLSTTTPCTPADNYTAFFDGPVASCATRAIGSVWYYWDADFSGIARLNPGAGFNETVSLFTGKCDSLQVVGCDNRDEHGFTSEHTYWPVQAGTRYYIRVSGAAGDFGLPRGPMCPRLEQVNDYPQRPAHDACQDAQWLTPNATCAGSTNANAEIATPLPSLNRLARADVWYKFTAVPPAPGERWVLQSHATFSDAITVYIGVCANLTEVAATEHGGALELPPLQADATYYVQIAGNFATVEGALCPELRAQPWTTPANDDCMGATEVPMNGPCVAGSNRDASFSGHYPACAAEVAHDIWFKFTAPASGAVYLNTGAAFEHTLALWEGACDSLVRVFCAQNPLRCNGYVPASGLKAGQTYYLQIAAWHSPAGFGTGEVCVQVRDGQSPPDFQPLSLTVHETCTGKDTARLVLSATGGVPPYTFPLLSTGHNIRSGSAYIATVLDAMGCEAHISGVAAACDSNSCTLQAALEALDPGCDAGADGRLRAIPAGGTPPYTYLWASGARTAAIDSLSAGTYTVTITDANACDRVLAYTLVAPPPLVLVADTIVEPVLGLFPGQIQVSVSGGSSPYTLEWFRNDTLWASGTAVLDSLPGGEYLLALTDSKGCRDSASFLLTETVDTRAIASAAAQVFVYPNPARRQACLHFRHTEAARASLRLTDAFGHLLFAQNAELMPGHPYILELEDLPGGVYLLLIQVGRELFVRKLIHTQ